MLLVDFAKVLRSRGMDRIGNHYRRPNETFGHPDDHPGYDLWNASLALAIGVRAEMRAPMARAVVRGQSRKGLEEFLTLFVVPVASIYVQPDNL